MKLDPEILRFAFLMQKVKENYDHLNIAELESLFEEAVGEVALGIDFEISSLIGNPRVFAESCARAATLAMAMTANVNQLPVVRHGLIEAMNDHCV
jgi:hypothetical protein